MRILLIHNYYKYRGGEETYIHNVISLLRENGHEVAIFSKDTEQIAARDKVFVALGLFWNIPIMRDVGRVVNKFQPDIALVQNVFPLIGLSIYHELKKRGIPIVQRISNYRLVCPKTTLYRNAQICERCVGKQFMYPSILYGCYNGSRIASFIFSLSFFFHRYVLKSMRHVSAYIFPSEFIQKYISNHFGIPGSKSHLVPSFAFPIDSKANRLSKDKKRHFLFAGRLTEEKGILDLINLFKSAQLKHVDLVIVGNGPLKKTIMERIRGARNISYKGVLKKEGIVSLLSQAYALLMPSNWYDVLPNIALESFSVGTPVIAPRLGTFSTLISHGKNGFLYRSRVELKSFLLSVMSGNLKLGHKMVLQSSRKYLCPTTHYQQLMKIFHEASKTA